MAKGGMIVTKPHLDVAYKHPGGDPGPAGPGRRGGGDLHRLPGGGRHQDGPQPADGFAILMHKDGTVIVQGRGQAMKPASEIDNDLTNAPIEQSKSGNSLVPAYFDNEGP